jgi:outer membrane lipoprotein-sorting protein
MKILRTLALGISVLISQFAHAQTAEEIIAKNIEAMGGAEKIASLKSVKQTASMNVQGMEIPFNFQISHGKGFRMDIEAMGTSNYQVNDNTSGSRFFPIQQMSEPKVYSPEEVESAKASFDLHGLYGYKEKGWVVTFDGKDKVDGADAFKLKVERNKETSIYYIDVKSYRVSKVSSKVKGENGEESDVDITYSDYKQNKDGYWFAYTMQNGGMPAPVTYSEIETNVAIDENIFKP